jgi:hypothetical protein
MDFGGMVNRMIRAATLQVDVFEEVEHDPTKDQEALVAVVTVAVINGILGFLGSLVFRQGASAALLTLVFGIIGAVVIYLLYAYLAFFIGTRLFGGTADFGELRRVLGYAYAPNIFGSIPCLGWVIAPIWVFVAGVVAIRQALDVDTANALLTSLIAVAVAFAIVLIIGAVFGVTGAALGAFTP